MMMHLNSLLDGPESKGSQGRLLLLWAIQSISQKAWKGKQDFSLCAFLFPGSVTHSKAALWFSGQAQRYCLYTGQFLYYFLKVDREYIIPVLYLLKAQKGLSVDVGD